IKVSKACYTCRVKKIKCDGLIPCMQCKARQRVCSFSTDSSGDPSQIRPPPPPTTTFTAMQSPSISTTSGTSPPSISPHQSTLNMSSKSSTATALREKQLLESTTQQLESLGQSWPGCEYEDSERYQMTSNQVNPWSYPHPQKRQKQQLPDAPSLSFFLVDPSSQSLGNNDFLAAEKVVTSSFNIQHNLISLYYRHRHQLLPLLPKSTLHVMLSRPSPEASVSLLLLNIIYAHAAQTSSTSFADADRYANTAKSMLDDYMDTPHLSTIIALILLSLYDSNGQGYTASPYQVSIYSAMAIRMCFDLKLHNNRATENVDDDNDGGMIKMIAALKLRVLWCCFCLDKWTNMGTGRPWLIHSVDIGDKMELNESLVLIMEGLELDRDEQAALEGLIASIQLAQLGEQLLHQPSSSTLTSINAAIQADQQLLSFLHQLPASLQWTPLPTPDSLSSPTSSLYQPIPSHPPHNAIVSHIHLIFNYLHLELLTRPLLGMTTSIQQLENHQNKVKMDQVSLLLHRCATVATNLTQLGCALTDQTGFILCYRLVAQALMLSVRVHLIKCYGVIIQPSLGTDYHQRPSKHARLMFQRSLRSLRGLVQHRVIPGTHEFTLSIERTLTTLDSLPQRDPHQDTSSGNIKVGTPQSTTNTQHNQQPSYYHQLPQQHDYLNVAEQSAAEILSNAFNTNNARDPQTTVSNNDTTYTPSQLSTAHPTDRPKSHSLVQQQQQQSSPLVDMTSLYTSDASNHVCKQQQQQQQIQPHYGYSFTSGKQDEVWALQEQYQQQQEQQQQQPYHPSLSATYNTMNMYSTPLWHSPSSSSTSLAQNLDKNATKAAHLSSSSSSPSSSTSTYAATTPSSSSIPINTAAIANPSASSSSLGIGSAPYKSIGLGVYASAHRHHSDVI
ncbi:fungal-specific transcription factor domain-domain-containing protein, partial [Absidia repens]